MLFRSRLDCLRAIVDASTSLGEARAVCHTLFIEKDRAVILSSGHRSKGLEWDTVIHLDPWRIPSPYALSAQDLIQEANLKYVIETRAKSRLVLADLDDPTI